MGLDPTAAGVRQSQGRFQTEEGLILHGLVEGLPQTVIDGGVSEQVQGARVTPSLSQQSCLRETRVPPSTDDYVIVYRYVQ